VCGVFASDPAKTQIFKTTTDQNNKMQQQNHKPNTCMAAENYQIKIELVGTAVTLKAQLVQLKMANWAETCSVY
jgi:hypothetical protein